jgi:hypothetical protein
MGELAAAVGDEKGNMRIKSSSRRAACRWTVLLYDKLESVSSLLDDDASVRVLRDLMNWVRPTLGWGGRAGEWGGKGLVNCQALGRDGGSGRCKRDPWALQAEGPDLHLALVLSELGLVQYDQQHRTAGFQGVIRGV